MDRACKLGGNAISLRLERCWSKHSWSGFYDTHVILTNNAALLGSTNRRRRQVRLACSFISNKCATFLVGRFASPRCRKGSSTLYVRKPVKIFFFHLSLSKNEEHLHLTGIWTRRHTTHIALRTCRWRVIAARYASSAAHTVLWECARRNFVRVRALLWQ